MANTTYQRLDEIELRMLHALKDGIGEGGAATRLGVSTTTVHKGTLRIHKKLNVSTTAAALAIAVREKWLSCPRMRTRVVLTEAEFNVLCDVAGGRMGRNTQLKALHAKLRANDRNQLVFKAFQFGFLT
jgi:DNA-binding CsgD family transcriptional regulator